MPPRSSTRIRRVSTPALQSSQRDAMWSLYAAQGGLDERPRFEVDLAEMHWALLCEDERGELVGYGTLLVDEHEVDGREHGCACTNDEVVADAELAAPLERALLRALLRARLGAPLRPLWWLRPVASPRLYSQLAVRHPGLWPRAERDTPPELRTLIDLVARQRWRKRWSPATGTLHMDAPMLEPREPTPAPETAAAQWFRERNPAYARAEALACLLPIDWRTCLGALAGVR